jgi:hypothetical protein
MQEPGEAGGVRTDGPTPSWLSPLHGSLQARYRARWVSRDDDHDLYEVLSLSYGSAEQDVVSGSLSVRFAEDLDGDRRTAGYSPFDSADDTYRHASTARLFTACLDVHPGAGFRLRGGRQALDGIPEAVPMDGGLARQAIGESITVAAFGGLPVNLFESSTEGDAMYGGWIEAAPWKRGLLKADYLHLEDENAFGLFDDDLIGISFEQGSGPLVFSARHTLLEGESRETLVRLSGLFPEDGFRLDARVSVLYERQQALSYPLDPYSILLLELEPYVQGSLTLSKSFGDAFGIDASATSRELAKDDDEGSYNREFLRVNVTPRLQDWPFAGLSLSAAGDYWRSTADDFWTLGGELAWSVHPKLTLTAGSSYALYTIDAFTGEERERVRSFSATARWKVHASMVLDVRFSVDDSELDRFRVLDVGVRHAF